MLLRLGKSAIPVAGLLALISPCQSLAGPEEDRQAFVAYYLSEFPGVPFEEFANGIYALDDDARSQWQSIEDFPPYEFSIERGAELWSEAFPNGQTLAECLGGHAADIRPRYPRFEAAKNGVITLQLAINECRATNGVAEWEFSAADMIDLAAFLAHEARGRKIDVQIPPDQPGALAAYEAGKRFYYTKRGQLNFACADCHITSVGQYVRADRLGPSLGHPTHFPVYRSKLGGMISLHQRFHGCVRDVRAKPFALQSAEYRNLEFFLSYMSNGLEINGPGSRK